MHGRDQNVSPDDFGPFAAVDDHGYSIKQQFAGANVMITGNACTDNLLGSRRGALPLGTQKGLPVHTHIGSYVHWCKYVNIAIIVFHDASLLC